jgi:isopenicillin N synthase-like dioxygenase
MILFCGETLARLTGGYYKAIVHSVISSNYRFSLPFFFRAKNNSILDCKKMNSIIISELIEKDKKLNEEISLENLLALISTQYRNKNHIFEIANYKDCDYYNL